MISIGDRDGRAGGKFAANNENQEWLYKEISSCDIEIEIQTILVINFAIVDHVTRNNSKRAFVSIFFTR